MAKATTLVHQLQDDERRDEILKRLKRAHGQLAGVIKMLEEKRDCADIVTQMSAVNKAVTAAAFTLISSSLRECLLDENREVDDVVVALQKLFLQLT